mmetsp:Transcript_4952/g.5110  ORF Transcript_4952/g.5110 Transcript_4952/m.5110 type:complete len:86 (+) Transcript_4952:238-495(+)
MIGKKAKIKNVRPAQISIKWGNTNEILEATFYKSGQDIMDIKRCLLISKERHKCELNRNKSWIKFEISVIGSKERIDNKKNPDPL